MSSHVLLIHCPDEKGLLHKISGVLYRNDLNVISNGEFVEKKFSHFFMRAEFSGNFDRQGLLRELYEVLPEKVHIKLTDRKKKDIVIMATKEHHCLSDLLIRHAFGELNANILGVISNHDVLRDITEKFNIPFHYIPAEGKERTAHEAEVLARIRQYQPEFLVLAKYMRILSPEFVGNFPDRIINIHHSFLPAFVGANPYNQAYQRGVKIIGATAHFVNDHLDEGPIIVQDVFPVDHTHSAQEMAQAGRDIEKNILARALRLVFNEHVFVYNHKTFIFD